MRAAQNFAMLVGSFAVALIGFSAAQAQDWRRITVTTYLRAGPSVQYRAIDEAQTGTRVAVLGCAGGWCRIAYGGAGGYVAQSLLAPAADTAEPLKNPACFTDRQAGYHGGRDVRFCHAQRAP